MTPTLYTPLEVPIDQVTALRLRLDELSKQASNMGNALLVITLQMDLILRQLSDANEAWASHDCIEATAPAGNGHHAGA